ncbi:MAG: NAD(P)H-dependent oxidoreductase [Nitrososphaerota archaeon]|nr:NAD(P)H-dependent oxidoreductase [Nitrososphaerota archaeon]
MADTIKILGFAGSLRKASFNKMLLNHAFKLLPQGCVMEIFDLEGIPIFNQDFENTPPPTVIKFKERIRANDALLIATPEYNYSIPGILKNAIDWASRPPSDNVFNGKPVALMSASNGMLGGARAQYHLRQSFVTLNMFPVNKPEVIVSFAKDKFDRDGRLADDASSKFMSELLANLVSLSRKLRG